MTRDEIQEAIKGFVQTALGLDHVESYVIVAVDKKNNVRQHNYGHNLLVYGMLDFVKRQMFVRMGETTCSKYAQTLKDIDEKTAKYAKEVSDTLETAVGGPVTDKEDEKTYRCIQELWEKPDEQ